MDTIDITSVSSKGQIVIPNKIRKILKIKTGTKLAVITDGENLLLKKINIPKAEEFDRLIKQSRAIVKKRGIKKSDVDKIIKSVRKKKR